MTSATPGGRVPSLSLVVATHDGWTAYRPCFEGHRREVEAVGGELIVMDGSGQPPPDPADLGPAVRWEQRPGLGVNALRLPGYALARAPIVAQTEDHVLLADGWATAVLGAHADHPSAMAIGGAMDNGTRATATDRASFLLGYAPFIRPFGTARRVVTATWGLVSFRREALAGMADLGGVGANEAIHQRALYRAGAEILMDDRIVGAHVQSLTPGAATRVHLHAGRAMAATRRAGARTGRDWARILVAPLLPVPLTLRVLAITLRRRRYVRDALTALPVLLWLFTCRSAGEIVGTLAGPGDSAAQLH